MSEFEVKNLIRIRLAVDRHNTACPAPPKAILLNPVDHGLMGFDELWGIPVLADDRVRVKLCRIECDGSAQDIEEELAAYLNEPEVS